MMKIAVCVACSLRIWIPPNLNTSSMQLKMAKCGDLRLGAGARAGLRDSYPHGYQLGECGRDGGPEHHGCRFCSRAPTKRAGVSLCYINQGSCESEQGIDWHLNMSLVRWGKGTLVYIWFPKFRKEVERPEEVEKRCWKVVQGLEQMFCSEKPR